MPGAVRLRVIKGPEEGREFAFDKHDTFIFGRERDCTLRLEVPDSAVSRYHFLIEVNPPHAKIRDLGSLNGTYVNGVKHGGRERHAAPNEARRQSIPEVEIQSGDEIEVGRTVMVCEIDQPDWRAQPTVYQSRRLDAVASQGAPSGQGGVSTSEFVGRWGTAFQEPAVSGQPAASGEPAVSGPPLGSDDTKPANELLEMMVEEARAQNREAPVDIAGLEILRLLGKGAFGAVYLAKRKADAELVALKVLLSEVAVNEDMKKRFRREIQVMRGLDHPNIVPLLAHGDGGSGFYFVSEFCAGGTVTDHLQRNAQPGRRGRLTLPAPEAMRIMFDALEGLAYAHQQKHIHRDLKPDNILLTAVENGTAKLGDFGLAKNFDLAGLSGYTLTGQAAGTYEFMPREQIINFKYVKPVSDVWAMAATLYFLLTGSIPRDFERGEDPVRVVLNQPAVPIQQRDGSIPAPLARVIDRALSTDLGARPQNAAELRDALRGVV